MQIRQSPGMRRAVEGQVREAHVSVYRRFRDAHGPALLTCRLRSQLGTAPVGEEPAGRVQGPNKAASIGRDASV